jgi:DNA-directed RNA polymerase specialized sigma24 family protein
MFATLCAVTGERVPPSPAELFERHHLVVYRYLLRLTGSREDEDLTQGAFLRAVTHNPEMSLTLRAHVRRLTQP